MVQFWAVGWTRSSCWTRMARSECWRGCQVRRELKIFRCSTRSQKVSDSQLRLRHIRQWRRPLLEAQRRWPRLLNRLWNNLLRDRWRLRHREEPEVWFLSSDFQELKQFAGEGRNLLTSVVSPDRKSTLLPWRLLPIQSLGISSRRYWFWPRCNRMMSWTATTKTWTSWPRRIC